MAHDRLKYASEAHERFNAGISRPHSVSSLAPYQAEDVISDPSQPRWRACEARGAEHGRELDRLAACNRGQQEAQLHVVPGAVGITPKRQLGELEEQLLIERCAAVGRVSPR